MSASTDLVRWQAAVASGDPARVGTLARTLAAEKSKASPEWIFTVCDNLWRPVGELGADLIEGSGTDPRNAVPSGTVTVKGSSPMVGELMKCRDTMVGLKVETAGLKFPFYVKKHTLSYKNGAHQSVSELRGIYAILYYYVIIPTWFLPIQIQPISHAVYFGPIVTVIETMIAECALRIQAGINEFLNNAASLNPDMRAWFGTLLQSDGNLFEVLKRPVYVVRTNMLLDGSPTVVRPVRMETVGQVIADLTGPYGIDVSMTLWEPGDPQPDEWANLTHPTYVVRVRDRSQIEGPTKTVLDSAIRTTVDLAGSLFGNAVKPLIQSVDGVEAAFVSPALGVNFVEPWIILEVPEPGGRGSVLSAEIVDHAHEGWRHIVGGKSPAWLNALINATLSWLLDSVTIVIGLTGVPSDLLSGFLNDAFFAFQQYDHYDRRAEGGPYHPAVERFHATQSSGYNVEAIMNFIKALWESKGYTSATVTFRNAEVATLGVDFFKSMLLSLVYMSRTRMLTDFVENIMWRITTAEREILAQIGDGRAEEPPLAKHQRNITGLFASVNALTLAPKS